MEYEGETFHLTEYQIKKTVKVFNYLDKKKRGLLKFEEELVKATQITPCVALTHAYTFAGFFSLLGSLLRCSGYNVSLKEIDKIKDKIIENKIREKNVQVNEKRETETTAKEEEGNNDTSNRKRAEKTNDDHDDDDNDNNNNISKLLSDLKNYDNFIELEKQKEEKKKKEEENKNLFSIKEFFRIIQLPNITNETKPSNVLNSFEIFDEKGNGRISIKKLRFILQYLGEPLSNADFDEFFDWIKTKDKVYKTDYIIYEDLLNELVNKDTSV